MTEQQPGDEWQKKDFLEVPDEPSMDGSGAEKGARSLKELREQYRNEAGDGVKRFGEMVKKHVGGKVLDAIAFVRSTPEMVRRTPEKMRQVRTQVGEAKDAFKAFAGQKTKEGFAVARTKAIEARAGLNNFVAEKWHFSKRNKESRRSARELAANKAGYAEVLRQEATLEAEALELKQRQRTNLAAKMELKDLIGEAAAAEVEKEVAGEEAEEERPAEAMPLAA